MSRNETLEKWGIYRPLWTFWTSSPVGAGCRFSWQEHTVAVKETPAGAGGSEQVQNVQTGGSTPVFSSVSLRDLGPGEVQTGIGEVQTRGVETGTLAPTPGWPVWAGVTDCKPCGVFRSLATPL